jgi:hypothetical protein
MCSLDWQCRRRAHGHHHRQARRYLHDHSHALGDKFTIYHVHRRSELVARAVLRLDQVRDVLVYRVRDRRHGIASALYRLIEEELGRPLKPSRIRSAAGQKFWANRRGI